MGGKVEAQSALCPSAPFSDPASPRVSALCPHFLPACLSLQLPHFCGTFLPGPSQCPRALLPSASSPLPLLTPVAPATGHLLPPHPPALGLALPTFRRVYATSAAGLHQSRTWGCPRLRDGSVARTSGGQRRAVPQLLLPRSCGWDPTSRPGAHSAPFLCCSSGSGHCSPSPPAVGRRHPRGRSVPLHCGGCVHRDLLDCVLGTPGRVPRRWVLGG